MDTNNTQSQIAEIMAQLAELRKENEALKRMQAHGGRQSLSLSEKGGIICHGIGFSGLHLYRAQWVKLFTVLGAEGYVEVNGVQMPKMLVNFIEANRSALSERPDDYLQRSKHPRAIAAVAKKAVANSVK